jgi:N-acetylglucosaminyl-diphospho-decaprenol L-rhamnosyltransferase
MQDLHQHCRDVVAKVILTCNLPEALPFGLDDFGYPIEIISNQAPKGFGANHNQAFCHCESAWFLILNPDVRIDRNVLIELLSLATPRTGILAPQEYSVSGEQVENLRGPITPYELVERHLLKRPGPRPATGWVKGMFMLARTEAFRSVNGFDQRYLMYCEDFDLCARLIRGDWTIDHHKHIPVTHVWERKSSRSPKHLTYHLASLFRMWSSIGFWQYWRRNHTSQTRA